MHQTVKLRSVSCDFYVCIYLQECAKYNCNIIYQNQDVSTLQVSNVILETSDFKHQNSGFCVLLCYCVPLTEQNSKYYVLLRNNVSQSYFVLHLLVGRRFNMNIVFCCASS